ncbi:MarR family winged helix-turn-helix transcriptional regulator [Amycolatopsis sp. QT-25]|uniref:MarR family winged helix-turn-helix transcriptional regulator n=1 Tax=Amycolatopsis sp. QT-25 TaxID=3034022 RepID=UPI0023EDB112|nr:MarR family winged helix-turn-helix transcriptional regulator [Amycolatopsis sp. QT-25]WET76747.1 MarR family winged helix-turn-helix transcriptional regulator [Amycolatopsis sp. QT-25]
MTGSVREAVTTAVGAGGALGEALIAIKDQPDRTAEWLSEVLHISQPGTAHLVRRLIDQGWVTRPDRGRARPLRLTPAGERQAASALAGRKAVLDRFVGRLSEEQCGQLIAITGALLSTEARSESLLAELCRLCDRASCPACPVHEGWQRNCSG